MANKVSVLRGIKEISIDSPFHDVIAYENGRFKNLSKSTFEQSRKNFKNYDLDADGFLNVNDVTKMMEKLGEAKTALEVKQMIAEIDDNNDGKVSFAEFLGMLCGKDYQGSQNVLNGSLSSFSVLGRIYNSNLAKHAAFFEQAAESNKDKSEENKNQIRKEYDEKKKVAELRKIELDKAKAEEEAEASKKEESRQRLAAMASRFEKGA